MSCPLQVESAEPRDFFLLFSSNYSPRYQRNILDILCLPDGYIFTFRYQKKYVHPDLITLCGQSQKKQRAAFRKATGISVYAERVTNDDNSFNHFPIRHLRLLRILRQGTVYYVKAKLGEFFNYGSDPLANLARVRPLLRYEGHPLPPPNAAGSSRQERAGDQGYFFDCQKLDSRSIGNAATGSSSREAWESVIEALGLAPTMKKALFFYILGLFELRNNFLIPHRYARREIAPRDSGWSTYYVVPNGSRLELDLLFYRSSQADRSVLPQALELKWSREAFGGVSREEISVLSRYNEELIEIATKRVLERVIAPIQIKLMKPKESNESRREEMKEDVLAPEPFLVAYVEPSRMAVAAILFGLLLGPFLLTMGPDVMKDIAGRLPSSRIVDWVVTSPGNASQLARVLGSVITVLTGYLGLRKLPVGK